MGKPAEDLLLIKHSRADRGYVITRKNGGRVGSVICNQTSNGMDVFITNEKHEVWMVLDLILDAVDSVAFLIPAGPIVGKVGNFRLFGRLARTIGRLGNKFVFQPAGDQDIFVVIGSALSRSFVVRRGGTDVATIVKGTRTLEIVISEPLTNLDKAIMVGIAIATCLQAELKSNLEEDMKIPKVLMI